MDMMTTTTLATAKKRLRRTHSAELKTQVLAECAAPGASVAKVAMAHGINANVVHTWRSQAREQTARTSAPTPTASFVPMLVAHEQPPCARDDGCNVRIDLQRGTLTMSVTWPLDAAAALSAWTREVLR